MSSTVRKWLNNEIIKKDFFKHSDKVLRVGVTFRATKASHFPNFGQKEKVAEFRELFKNFFFYSQLGGIANF